MTLVTAGGAGAERASNHTAFVVDQLGRSIVAGEYPAETMIPLDPDLCEMFGVSRTVVREAKKTLIAKGLIQSKAKVGTHVRPAVEWNLFDEDVLRWHTSIISSAEPISRAIGFSHNMALGVAAAAALVQVE